jgi:tetratricopeptide (TPR) repeat protein
MVTSSTTTSASFEDQSLVFKYRWHLVALGAAVLLLLIGLAWQASLEKNKSTQAANLYFSARNAENPVQELRSVADQYPESSAGMIAGLDLAKLLGEEGNWEESASRYVSVAARTEQGFLKSTAHMGAALAYEQLENWQEAAKQYESVIALQTPGFKGEALLGLGRVHAAAGDRQKSNLFLQQIIDDESMPPALVEEARIRLGVHF